MPDYRLGFEELRSVRIPRGSVYATLVSAGKGARADGVQGGDFGVRVAKSAAEYWDEVAFTIASHISTDLDAGVCDEIDMFEALEPWELWRDTEDSEDSEIRELCCIVMGCVFGVLATNGYGIFMSHADAGLDEWKPMKVYARAKRSA